MPTLTRAQVRELDRRAIEEYGVPGIVLMENAGRGAAEVLMRLNPERRPVMVFCGKGNNGGDGYVIARHLDIHGWPVAVMASDGPSGLTGDAAINYRVALASGIRIVSPMPNEAKKVISAMREYLKAIRAEVDALENRNPTWAVDALFGTGLSGPIRGQHSGLVEALNRGIGEGVKVLAVDIPSGLDCDTGK